MQQDRRAGGRPLRMRGEGARRPPLGTHFKGPSDIIRKLFPAVCKGSWRHIETTVGRRLASLFQATTPPPDPTPAPYTGAVPLPLASQPRERLWAAIVDALPEHSRVDRAAEGPLPRPPTASGAKRGQAEPGGGTWDAEGTERVGPKPERTWTGRRDRR